MFIFLWTLTNKCVKKNTWFASVSLCRELLHPRERETEKASQVSLNVEMLIRASFLSNRFLTSASTAYLTSFKHKRGLWTNAKTPERHRQVLINRVSSLWRCQVTWAAAPPPPPPPLYVSLTSCSPAAAVIEQRQQQNTLDFAVTRAELWKEQYS